MRQLVTSRHISIYAVRHSGFEIYLTSLHTTMDVFKIKDRKVQIRNSGVKGLTTHEQYLSKLSITNKFLTHSVYISLVNDLRINLRISSNRPQTYIGPVSVEWEMDTLLRKGLTLWKILLNLNSSNNDGSFTMANWNAFFDSLRDSSDSSRKQIFLGNFHISSWNCTLCVLFRIASSRRF